MCLIVVTLVIATIGQFEQESALLVAAYAFLPIKPNALDDVIAGQVRGRVSEGKMCTYFIRQ